MCSSFSCYCQWFSNCSNTPTFVAFEFFLKSFFKIYLLTPSIFSNIHLLRETRQQLRKEASFMETLLKPMPLDSNTISQRIRRNHSIRLAGRLFESEIIIINSNRKLVFQNVESFVLREFRNILSSPAPQK